MIYILIIYITLNFIFFALFNSHNKKKLKTDISIYISIGAYIHTYITYISIGAYKYNFETDLKLLTYNFINCRLIVEFY